MSSIDGDLRVSGRVICGGVDGKAAYISDADVETGAGIAATKLEHQHQQRYSQPNTAATAETRAVHVVYGATGDVIAFKVGSIAKAIGDSTVTVDLKKNGTTILTGVVTLNSSNTARVAVSGTLVASPTLAAGDLLEVVITATIGTGTLPTGVFCEVILREDADP